MKKSDLKNGDIIETSIRNHYIVIDEYLINLENGGFMGFYCYDDNLRCKGDAREWDIEKVWSNKKDQKKQLKHWAMFNYLSGKEPNWTCPQLILDDVEKKYLEAVLKPFRRRIKSVTKFNDGMKKFQFIGVRMQNIDGINLDNIFFPLFKKNAMYKNMEVGREYTIAELGLFEET